MACGDVSPCSCLCHGGREALHCQCYWYCLPLHQQKQLVQQQEEQEDIGYTEEDVKRAAVVLSGILDASETECQAIILLVLKELKG